MSINNPPKYRYLLPDDIDKEMFGYIKNRGNRPLKLIGNNKDQFIITLIRTQKSLHDWRGIWIDIFNELKEKEELDIDKINSKYPSSSIGKDIPDWVTYEGDRIVNDFIDELEHRKIKFNGDDNELSEFILRFWLAQLGDWESSILMIWEMLGDNNEIYLKDLNNELKGFDYLGLFNH